MHTKVRLVYSRIYLEDISKKRKLGKWNTPGIGNWHLHCHPAGDLKTEARIIKSEYLFTSAILRDRTALRLLGQKQQ